MTLDDYLGKAYALDIKGQHAAAISLLAAAINEDPSISVQAIARLAELNALLEARGPLACAFSTKYQQYLSEALAP